MVAGRRAQKFDKYFSVLLALWCVGWLVFFLYSKNWRNAFLLGSPLVAIGVAYLISYVAHSRHSEPGGKKTEWRGASFLVLVAIYASLQAVGALVFGTKMDSRLSISSMLLLVVSILFLGNLAVVALINRCQRKH